MLTVTQFRVWQFNKHFQDKCPLLWFYTLGLLKIYKIKHVTNPLTRTFSIGWIANGIFACNDMVINGQYLNFIYARCIKYKTIFTIILTVITRKQLYNWIVNSGVTISYLACKTNQFIFPYKVFITALERFMAFSYSGKRKINRIYNLMCWGSNL